MRDSDRSVRKWKPAEDESLDLVPPEIKKMKCADEDTSIGVENFHVKSF